VPATRQDQPPKASSSVWRLAWPTIISNLLFTTVGFMHIKIVAELGTSAVAAVTTGHRVFFLIQAILMGVSVAATALIARSWGAGDVQQAERIHWSAMGLALVLAGALSIPILIAPEAIAGLFGLDQATTLAAAGFIFWLGVRPGLILDRVEASVERILGPLTAEVAAPGDEQPHHAGFEIPADGDPAQQTFTVRDTESQR